MGRNAWTEDGATVTETLSTEIIQKAIEDMAWAVYEKELRKQKGE